MAGTCRESAFPPFFFTVVNPYDKIINVTNFKTFYFAINELCKQVKFPPPNRRFCRSKFHALNSSICSHWYQFQLNFMSSKMTSSITHETLANIPSSGFLHLLVTKSSRVWNERCWSITRVLFQNQKSSSFNIREVSRVICSATGTTLTSIYFCWLTPLVCQWYVTQTNSGKSTTLCELVWVYW